MPERSQPSHSACRTPGAVYGTRIEGDVLSVSVKLPRCVTEEEANLVEQSVHKTLEASLAPIFETPTEQERFHLLATIVAYPSMSTANVCERANDECQHDLFDPLPPIAPQAMSGKLKSLERDGLIVAFADVDGPRWDPTDEGRQAWALYVAVLGA